MKTTVIGSYPIPAWLAAFPSRSHLRDAILVALKIQELAGIDVISDGEISRFDVNHPETNGMIEYFIRPLGGIGSEFSRAELALFQARQGMRFRTQPAGVVREKISEGKLNLVQAWEEIRSLTTRPLKWTVTSPYMLAKTVFDLHYRDQRQLSMAFAAILREQISAIDAAVVQVDEANLTGHPEDVSWAHEPINHLLEAVRGRKAVHLCFGNYGGQSIQKGFWRDLLPFFNRLSADHLLLEFARRGYGELQVFRDLRPGISLGIGVIDIKDNEVETPEEVARRIERVTAVLGLERVEWVHPDCGFWMLPRNIADQKMRALVQGRDLFCGTGRE